MLHIGGWPCEMSVEAHDNRHVSQIIDELRSHHDEALGSIDISLCERDSFSWGFGIEKLKGDGDVSSSGSLASVVQVSIPPCTVYRGDDMPYCSYGFS